MTTIRRLLSFSTKEAQYLLEAGIVPFENFSYENLMRILHIIDAETLNHHKNVHLMLEVLSIKFKYFLSQIDECKDNTSFYGYILFEKELFIEGLTKVHQ